VVTDRQHAAREMLARHRPPARAAGRTERAGVEQDVRPPGLNTAQERMWFLDHMDPKSGVYNVGSVLACAFPVNFAETAAALNVVVNRHESLRSCFLDDPDGGPPRRIVKAAVEVPVGRSPVDLASDADGIDERIAEVVRAPFNIARAPLVRAEILHCTDEVSLVVLVLHHIVSDGWSVGLLLRDLAAAMRAEPLPPAPGPEGLVQAECAYLRSPRAARDRQWWAQRLAGAPLTTAPLATRSRAGATGGHTVTVDVGARDAERLEHVAEQVGGSLYTIVAAAVALWAARSLDCAEVCLGSPVVDRRPADADVVGLAVNTVVLRSMVPSAGSVMDYLREQRDVVLDALEHRRLPFDQVVAAVGGHRGSGENPLFEVFIAHQNVPAEHPRFPGGSVRIRSFAAAQVRMPLEITTWRRADHLELRVGGRADRYDRATVQRMARQLKTVLEVVAADPEQPVAEVPVLPADEHRALLRIEQGPAAAPRAQTLHDMVLAAALTPAAVAVEDAHGALTFAELAQRSAAVASRLRAAGVGRGHTVGVAMPRSRAAVVAVLGVLRSGAAFVPLNLRDPVFRRSFMLEDAGARAAVLDGPADWLPEGVAPVQYAQCGPESELDDLPDVTGADLAYVLYTSGTTGRPKGVMVEHRNIVSTLSDCVVADGLTSSDVGLVTAAATFDVHYHELFSPISAGGRAYLVSHDELYDPAAIQALFARATTFQAVPGMMKHLLRMLGAPGPIRAPRVRRVMTGGDSVPSELLERIAATFPQAQISITYGPTETAIFATRYVVDDPTVPGRPIGRPIAGAAVRVVDRVGRRVPLGADGEIRIGGGGVSRGYRNRPEETAAAFVVAHDGDGEDERWYTTGDRGRWRPDGTLEFLGRRDDQVKVRGVRIELGEVENVAVTTPGVTRAIAVTAGTDADARLELYVIGRPAESAADRDIELVARWRELFDRTYGARVRNVVRYSDFTGWQSSYTGRAYPPEVMRDWQAATTSRVRDLLASLPGRPARRPVIAELGCGTGLLALEVAADTARYVASDLSARAVDDLRRRCRDLGLDEVEVDVGDAASAALPDGVDAVLLNSVSQYLPSAEYLSDTLDRCVTALAPGGFVFVGDVRNLATGLAFHREVGAARSVADATVEETAADRLAAEEELLLDPAWFTAWAARRPGVAVTLAARTDSFDTEMRRHRYDVVLTKGSALALSAPRPATAGADAPLANNPAAPAWQRELVQRVRERLTAILPEYMVPTGITVLDRVPTTPNGKLDRHRLPAPRRSASGTGGSSRPTTPMQRAVAAAWTAVLGHDDFRVDSDFFDVGGTSLLAVKLAGALRSAGCELTPHEVFDLRTVAAMASRADGSAPASRANAGADVRPELPRAAARPTGVRAPLSAARSVLLTGATGMLGVHVLHELLRTTDAHVVCLVRGDHPDWAAARVTDQLEWYLPHADEAVRERVSVVCGDLAERRLGLDPPDYDDLLGGLDHVVHCAADVRHAADRAEIFATNVSGTRHLLDAVRATNATLHHLSTVGVGGRTDRARVELDERTLYVGQTPTEAYSESKILAEDLVRRHLADCFAGSILRVGTIAPALRTGRTQRDIDGHFLMRMLRSTLLIGAVGDWPDRFLRPVPVDRMAAAVLGLAEDACPGGVTYHLEGRPMTHRQLATMLRELGYHVDILAPDVFAPEVDRRIVELGVDAAVGILPLLTPQVGVPVRLVSTASESRLHELGLELPPVDRAWLAAVLADGARRGYFPSPTAGRPERVGA
jgi:amino acid adenylation domain-containing protein/thioester reductase-like protein